MTGLPSRRQLRMTSPHFFSAVRSGRRPTSEANDSRERNGTMTTRLPSVLPRVMCNVPLSDDVRRRVHGSAESRMSRRSAPTSLWGRIAGMGVLFDYFAAPSDEEAVGVLNRVGGPSSQAVVVPSPEPKRSLFSRKQPPRTPDFATDPMLPVYDTASVKGIDPLVQMGTLEELLTGRPYDEIVTDERMRDSVLADRNGGERLICNLTDTLTATLASASDERLEQVAEPWSRTEEFWGTADPVVLAEFLRDLAGLARRAEANGQRLYCWVSV